MPYYAADSGKAYGPIHSFVTKVEDVTTGYIFYVVLS